MKYHILGAVWYTPPAAGLDLVEHAILGMPPIAFGFVAIKSGPQPDDWKCYAGFANGRNAELDEQNIAAHGVKVTKEVSCAHFPNLPQESFKF